MQRSIVSRYRGLSVRGVTAPAIAAAMLVLTSCERVPLLAPSGSSMMLVAREASVQLNGAITITAILIQDGTFQGGDVDDALTGGLPVHNGTRVAFLTTLGRVEPAETETKDGRAEVRLVAGGSSGIARITALSGAATGTLDVPVGSAAASRLTISASPQALPHSGGTTAIAARLEDRHGNPVTRVLIAFSTSAGHLSSPTAATNELGVASTSLATTSEATVTASAPGSNGVLSVSVTLSVQ